MQSTKFSNKGIYDSTLDMGVIGLRGCCRDVDGAISFDDAKAFVGSPRGAREDTAERLVFEVQGDGCLRDDTDGCQCGPIDEDVEAGHISIEIDDVD